MWFVVISHYWSMSKVIWDLLGLNTRYLFWVYLKLWCLCSTPPHTHFFFSFLDGLSLEPGIHIDLPVSVCQVLASARIKHVPSHLAFFFFFSLLNPTVGFFCLYARLASSFLCLSLLTVGGVAIGHHTRQPLKLVNSLRKALCKLHKLPVCSTVQ